MLYLKSNCFAILMFSLRLLTIISTQYPNARGCNIIYQYCGDMMFSGHTVIVLTQYLSMNTYLKIEHTDNNKLVILLNITHLLLASINLFLIHLDIRLLYIFDYHPFQILLHLMNLLKRYFKFFHLKLFR